MLDALSNFTYGTALAAMKEAVGIGALDHNQITVEGTDVPGEFTVTTAFRELAGATGQDGGVGVLRIMVETAKHRAHTTWRSHEQFSQVVDELLHQLTRAKAWGLSKPAPWVNSLDRLREALRLAISSQMERTDAQYQLQGSLAAVIAEGWFLTDAGLECPNQHYFLPRSKFPQYRDLATGLSRVPKINDLIEKPDWADNAAWSYALERCSARFTVQKLGSQKVPDPTLVPAT
ncbi:hypothetical protein [Arthrobacter sp. NPDC093139]|uniref:hypothetical protein n=1 Tax=Arthrobacter sp. NPDC093139 TaxID=3363945 RepID=UPI0038126D25